MKKKNQKNAPILEQVISKLEREQKKEIFLKKIGLIIYVLLLLAWSVYFGNLLYLSCIVPEGELNLWIQWPFQIILFVSALVFFGSYIRNQIAITKRQKLVVAIKDSRRYLEDCLVIPTPSILILSKLTNNPPPLFWDSFQTEVISLGWEGREKYAKKLHELEDKLSLL